MDFPEPTKVSPYFHIAVVLVVFFGGLRNLVYKSTPPSITTCTMSDTINDNPNDASITDKSDFLQVMTFAAQQHLRACDCDECDDIQVSLSMSQFMRERKRQRLESVPVKRTQHRELICRHPASSVAVYRYTMPLDAAPLVEFGTSHRLVWMQRLPPKSSAHCNAISSIGKGIIGSSDEENSRRPLPNWIQGKVFLVPSNGGKAVGWMYHHATQQKVKEDDKSQQQQKQQNGMTDKDEDAVIQSNSSPNGISGGPAVMIVAKIPSTATTASKDGDEDEDKDDLPDWVQMVVQCCQEGLKLHKEIPAVLPSSCYELPKLNATPLKDCLNCLIINNTCDDSKNAAR